MAYMTYPHAVIADGVFYPTGTPVPAHNSTDKAEAEKAAAEKADETTTEAENKGDSTDKAEAEKAAKKSAKKATGRKAKSTD